MKTKTYSVRVRIWTEPNFKGNMSEGYFNGFRANGGPKQIMGVDRKKVWQKKMFAEYYAYKLKDWFNGQLIIDSWQVDVVEN